MLLVPIVLLSMLGTAVTVGAASPSQGARAVEASLTPANVVTRPERVASKLALVTSSATTRVGQAFTPSDKLSASNSNSPGTEVLELYQSVNDEACKLFWTLTTQADGTFSKNLTYNTAATPLTTTLCSTKLHWTADHGATPSPLELRMPPVLPPLLSSRVDHHER